MEDFPFVIRLSVSILSKEKEQKQIRHKLSFQQNGSPYLKGRSVPVYVCVSVCLCMSVCVCPRVCVCVCVHTRCTQVHGYLSSLLQRFHRIYSEYRYMKASNKALVLLDFETRKNGIT